MFFLHQVGFTQDLEIKVNNESIKLPYWSASHQHEGGVILVRGGEPVQWSDALAHLAGLLSDSGWSTVLLNCTLDDKSSWIDQLPETITALRNDKNKRIFLIHYGEQLNSTLDYLGKQKGKTINGLVLLSAYDEKESTVKLSSFRFPVFDIDGQFDYDEVKSQAKARQKSENSPNYLVLELPGADHDYNYSEPLLRSFLIGWMLKTPETAFVAPPSQDNNSLVHSYIEPVYFLRRSV
jgi:hypothetical protein